MTPEIMLGFGLLLLGAICGGSFGLPSKFAAKDLPWEVLWGPFFFFATILLPLMLGPYLANDLFDTCQAAGSANIMYLLLPFAFGLLWGLGSMTLGLSFAFIGLSLAYAINYGAQIIVGGVGPILIHNPEELSTLHGVVIIKGVVVCLLGVIVAAFAGVLKTRSQEAGTATGSETDTDAPKKNISLGLLLAFASGVLCACWAIAGSFGGPLMETAASDTFGNNGFQSVMVLVVVILWGGSISSCLYCVYKLCVNKTWGRFASSSAIVAIALALVMALLHDGAVLLYCYGAPMLGELGVGIGYAVFMSFAIITGNVNGFLTGEWKGASQISKLVIAVAILILIVGVSVLGTGNIMQADAAKAVAAEVTEEPVDPQAGDDPVFIEKQIEDEPVEETVAP